MENRYWERIKGYFSEHKIDARYILREANDESNPPKAWGSLRIVSHPDLPPGFLRATASFVVNRQSKTQEEINRAIEDYLMDVKELEVYSVDEDIKTEEIVHEAPKAKIEELFGVDIFRDK